MNVVHRSGSARGGGRNRQSRSRPGLKEGVICTAAMRVFVLPDGKVEMTYFPEHWGHSGEIQLFLSKEQRQEIARRLAGGADPEQIIQECSQSDNPRLQAVDRHTIYRVIVFFCQNYYIFLSLLLINYILFIHRIIIIIIIR